jgi:hypothetical protein
MTGGLIQIVSQGSADLFLVGSPQITFFKIVYKKYTNFAIENIVIPLDSSLNFDTKITTTIPKTGDLVYKMYLQISIPSIQVSNPDKYIDNSKISDLNNQLKLNNALVPKYNLFFKYNFIILNGLSLEIQTIGSNWTTISNLIDNYSKNYSKSIASISISLYDVISKFNATFNFVNSATSLTLLNDVQTFIDNMKNYYKIEEKKLYQNIDLLKKGITNLYSSDVYPNVQAYDYFAWSDRLGFNLINKCSVSIGGYDISSFDSDFLNIYHSLNDNFKQRSNLDKMIGSETTLTNYDNLLKPSTTLYIPLPFWFTQHNGSC